MRRGLVWFRSDLRVHDNTALFEAARASRDLVGVFLVCGDQWREHDWGAPKVDFVLRNVRALAGALSKRGIPLRIRDASAFSAAPAELLRLARAEGCDRLYFNREYEVNELRRDRRVEARFERAGIPARSFHDQTVLPPDRLRTGQGGFYRVFTPFKRAWLADVIRGGVPSLLPPPGERGAETAVADAVPVPAQGFDSSRVEPDRWTAGEDEARARLDAFVHERIHRYRGERDFPAIEGTSALSPYLACGVLSPRQCLAAASDANTGSIESGNEGVTTWISELVWREFYRHVLVGFPRVCMNRAFNESTESIRWADDAEGFDRWREGRTGVPIVDAAMRQLRRTAWMHNRLRMIAAMYLSKNLFIDWRLGERYFMQALVDGDFANNNGGWQWSASTGCDAAPYFRMFNPVSQSKRYDPGGEFIRRFCPELAGLDEKAIHDPFSLSTEQRSKIDYPVPMIDQARARQRVMTAFRKTARTRG